MVQHDVCQHRCLMYLLSLVLAQGLLLFARPATERSVHQGKAGPFPLLSGGQGQFTAECQGWSARAMGTWHCVAPHCIDANCSHPHVKGSYSSSCRQCPTPSLPCPSSPPGSPGKTGRRLRGKTPGLFNKMWEWVGRGELKMINTREKQKQRQPYR